MSTSVVQPRGVPSKGPSPKTIATVVAGLALAIGVGFTMANRQAFEPASQGLPPGVSERVAQPSGAEVTQSVAERQMLMMQATKGITDSASVSGADLLILQRAAELAQAQRETLLMQATKGIGNALPASSAADFKIFQRAAELSAQRQTALVKATKGVVLVPILSAGDLWQSKIDFLSKQYAARNSYTASQVHDYLSGGSNAASLGSPGQSAREAESQVWDSRIEFYGEKYQAGTTVEAPQWLVR
jgi:hypothetical protein